MWKCGSLNIYIFFLQRFSNNFHILIDITRVRDWRIDGFDWLQKLTLDERKDEEEANGEVADPHPRLHRGIILELRTRAFCQLEITMTATSGIRRISSTDAMVRLILRFEHSLFFYFVFIQCKNRWVFFCKVLMKVYLWIIEFQERNCFIFLNNFES